MIIVAISEEKLKRSKYYDEDCWDYPISELSYLLEKEKDNKDEKRVFVLTEKNRVYETTYIMEQDIGGLL